MNLQGCGTALVTPFRPDGSLDEAALHALVSAQIAAGISLLIPCGTTGEASTLTEHETQRVIEITIATAAGRVPIFAGCTHNATHQAVTNARRLARIPGLTGLLSANPYYNRPSQEGQFQHFRAIAEAIDLPILLYNIPSRTSANLLPETILRLAELPNIAGVKESCGNLVQITELLTHTPPDFAVLAGDDALALPILALGGVATSPLCRPISPSPALHPSRPSSPSSAAAPTPYASPWFPSPPQPAPNSKPSCASLTSCPTCNNENWVVVHCAA